jgi:hypothetical protein
MTLDDVVPGTMALTVDGELYVVLTVDRQTSWSGFRRHVMVWTEFGFREWVMTFDDAQKDTLIRRGRSI